MVPALRKFLCCCSLGGIVLLLSVLQLGESTLVEIQGELGGKIRLPCDFHVNKSISFLYMQKPGNLTLFVNGFHAERPTEPDPIFKNRSEVDPFRRWVELKDLRTSDEGVYECVVGYSTGNTDRMSVTLNVTANYSEPIMEVVGMECSTILTCTSSGGFPRRDVHWNFQPKLVQNQWVEVNKSSVQDPGTMLVTVSSTIVLNASLTLNVSCGVGRSMSQQKEVRCNNPPPPSPPPPDATLISACAIISFLGLFLLAVVFVQLMRSCPRTNSTAMEEGTDPKELETLT